MNKSTDKIIKRGSRARKSISWLFAGAMALLQMSDANSEPKTDSTFECESCKGTRGRMRERLRELRDSSPKKETVKPQKKEAEEPTGTFDMSNCTDCQFG